MCDFIAAHIFICFLIVFFLQKKQKKLSKLANGAQPAAVPIDNPFGDNDEDEIARIAREMEAKYVRKKNKSLKDPNLNV